MPQMGYVTFLLLFQGGKINRGWLRFTSTFQRHKRWDKSWVEVGSSLGINLGVVCSKFSSATNQLLRSWINPFLSHRYLMHKSRGRNLQNQKLESKSKVGGLPWCPLTKGLHSRYKGPEFDPWWGTRSCVCAQSLNRFRLFATPCTIARQAPLSLGFSRQEHWRGLPVPTPGALPHPWIKPVSSALTGEFLPPNHQGRPLDPTCHNQSSYIPQQRLKIPSATTKTWAAKWKKHKLKINFFLKLIWRNLRES